MCAASSASRAGSSGWSGSSSWTCWNRSPSHQPESDEERDRAGGGREAGRLRVEADEGHVRRRLARQAREPSRSSGRTTVSGSQPDDRHRGRSRRPRRRRRPARPARCEPSAERLRSAADGAAGARRSRRAARKFASRRSRSARRSRRQPPRPATVAGAELAQQPEGERLRVDVRLEPRPGAGGAAAVAGARGDELRRPGDQLVVALEQPLARARSRRAPPRTGRSSAPRGAANGPGSRGRGRAGRP